MYEKDLHDFNCYHILNLNPFDAYSDEDIFNCIRDCKKRWTTTLNSRSSESEDKVRARFLLDSVNEIEARMKDPKRRKLESENAEKLICKLSQSLNRSCIVTSDGTRYVFPGEIYTMISDIEWDSIDEDTFISHADLKNEHPGLIRYSKLIPTVELILLCGMTSPSELLNRICDDMKELSGFILPENYDQTSFDKTLDACKQRLSRVQDSKYPMRDVYRQAVNSISTISDRDDRTSGLEKLCNAWCISESISDTMNAERHIGIFGREYVMDLIHAYEDRIEDIDLLISVLMYICYNRHIAINMSSDNITSVRCPSCLSILSNSETTICPICGLSLKNPCPKCNCLLDPTTDRCKLCGCDIAYSNDYLSERTKVIEQYLKNGKIHSAIMELSPIRTKYPYSRIVHEMEKNIDDSKKQRDEIISSAMKAYNSHNYHEANEGLSYFISKYPEDGSDYKNQKYESAAHVSKSRDLCAESERAQPNDRLEILLNASSMCPDNPDVLRRLAEYPPSAPVSAETVSHVGYISIHILPPSDTRMIKYAIYRRISGQKDSERIGIVSDTIYDDHTTVSGIHYEYDVFSERGNIRSVDYVSSNKSISLSEVGNPRSYEYDGTIELNFIKAVGSARTAIHRISSSGETVFFTDSDRFADSTVQPGESLRYIFKSIYKLGDLELYSDGVEITASVKPIIPKITDFRINECSEGFKAKWKCDADVILYLSDKKDRKYIGTDVLSTFNRSMKRIEPLKIINEGMIFVADKEGLFTITPVSVIGNYGREGVSMEIANIRPFKNVMIHNHGKECVIRMDWPVLASKARISWIVGDAENSVDMDKSEYTSEGFRINIDSDDLVVFKISAVYNLYQNDIESQPITIQCNLGERRLVSYSVYNGRRSKKVTIRAPGLTSIPPVIVVASPNSLPLMPYEGKVVWKTDKNLDIVDGMHIISIPFISSSETVRLFFRNVSDNDIYGLICDNWSVSK